MIAVYSDFLFRHIAKKHRRARWVPIRLEGQLGTIWSTEATGEPAFPARFILNLVFSIKSR
jgi:hypothetical protein